MWSRDGHLVNNSQAQEISDGSKNLDFIETYTLYPTRTADSSALRDESLTEATALILLFHRL